MLPSQWIHPKFNYFWGGFRKRDGALSQHSRGSELAPRNASQSHAQTVSEIYDRDFNALVQLARWTLRWWFIRISNFISLLLCHTLLGVHIEGPLSFFLSHIWCFLMTFVSLLPGKPMGTNRKKQLRTNSDDINSCPGYWVKISDLWAGALIELKCKTWTLCLCLFIHCWAFHPGFKPWLSLMAMCVKIIQSLLFFTGMLTGNFKVKVCLVVYLKLPKWKSWNVVQI